MKHILTLVFVTLVIENARCAMTEAQVKSATKVIRNVCQPKTRVTNAQIEVMHQGEFTENHELQCYMECVLRMGQILKDGKLNLDSVHTQMANLPPNLAQSAAAAIEKCKDSMKSSEKCAAAYEFYKCYYESSDPDNFFLP